MGRDDGLAEGAIVGLAVGTEVGDAVGALVGSAVGFLVGAAVGVAEGLVVGTAVGDSVQRTSWHVPGQKLDTPPLHAVARGVPPRIAFWMLSHGGTGSGI